MTKTVTRYRTTNKQKKEEPVVTVKEFGQKLEGFFKDVLLFKDYEPGQEPWLFLCKPTGKRVPSFEFTLAWLDQETGEPKWEFAETLETKLFNDEFNARRIGSAWANAINLKLGLVKAERVPLHRADGPDYID